MQQRHQDAAAGGADGVADGDGAAVDVDLVRVPLHFAVDRDRLRGESLVDFHQVEVAHAPARLLQAQLARRHRPHAHDLGIDAGRRVGADGGERLQADLYTATSFLGRASGSPRDHQEEIIANYFLGYGRNENYRNVRRSRRSLSMSSISKTIDEFHDEVEREGLERIAEV